jgi:MFS family permease
MSSPKKSEPFTAEAKRSLLAMFVTLFIDLVGFSIIFPLFPSMLEYYHASSAEGSFFALFYTMLEHLSVLLGVPNPEWGVLVLFGGILGSLYSLLQFMFTPLFGAVSDRIGRKPVLLFSLVGVLVSYVLWFFAAPFGVLVVARILGGIMSANIATASAVVADVTTQGNRSKGMAVIGMAFGLGFIIGPAIGGVSALLDLSALYPAWVAYGVNPYSLPAAAAFVLTTVNIIQVIFYFQETRRENVETVVYRRSPNPLRLFQSVPYPGVARTNWIYFIFLLSFSGMEFSLTFLTHERLDYGPEENAMMFLFIGLVLAIMQGSYVRRFSDVIGPKRMATHGLLVGIPALLFIAAAGHYESSALLFLGLLCLAVGAAQAMPCLTALASMYAPENDQGRMLGVFRSLGALARAIGPLLAALLYWQLGATVMYLIGAGIVLVPLLMMRALPAPLTHEAD